MVFIGCYWFFLVLHTESNFGKNPAEIWPGNPGRVLSAPQAPRFILGGSTPQTPSETCYTLMLNHTHHVRPKGGSSQGIESGHQPNTPPTNRARGRRLWRGCQTRHALIRDHPALLLALALALSKILRVGSGPRAHCTKPRLRPTQGARNTQTGLAPPRSRDGYGIPKVWHKT